MTSSSGNRFQPGSDELQSLDAQEMQTHTGVGSARRDREQTSTAQFNKWFGNSKVVGSDGKPMMVYHGTHEKFRAFDFSKARDGAHWFTPDESHAASFGDARPYYVSMSNPMEIAQDALDAAWDEEHPGEEQDDRCLLPRDFVDQFVAKARANGHDGLIIRDMGDRDIQSDMYLPFTPGQIKSAIGNNGNFDRNDPDICHSRTTATVQTAAELMGPLSAYDDGPEADEEDCARPRARG